MHYVQRALHSDYVSTYFSSRGNLVIYPTHPDPFRSHSIIFVYDWINDGSHDNINANKQ